MDNITLTNNAINKLSELLMEEYRTSDLSSKYFRVYIQGGGCSGFLYGFNFEDHKNEDDFEFPNQGINLIVDNISYEYLKNSSIDYIEGLMENKFVVKNPNATSTCSCGASFG